MQRRLTEVGMTEVELRMHVYMATYSRRQVAHREYKFDMMVVEVASGKGHA